MQKIFRFKTLKHQKTQDTSGEQRFFYKPIVFYNRQKQRTQIAWARITTTVIFLMLIWDSLAHAVTLEEEMQKLNKLAYGDFTQMGVGGGTILGVIVAVFRQSPQMFGVVLGLGVGLSFYLRWLKNHKFGE